MRDYLARSGSLNDRVIHAHALRLLGGVCLQIKGVCKHGCVGQVLNLLIAAINKP